MCRKTQGNQRAHCASERDKGLKAIEPIQLQGEPWLQLLSLLASNLDSRIVVHLLLLRLSSAAIRLLLHLRYGARHELVDVEELAGDLRRQDGLCGTHELIARSW